MDRRTQVCEPKAENAIPDGAFAAMLARGLAIVAAAIVRHGAQ
jgi:hypothetical protein